jgi:hypothetical protein
LRTPRVDHQLAEMLNVGHTTIAKANKVLRRVASVAGPSRLWVSALP